MMMMKMRATMMLMRTPLSSSGDGGAGVVVVVVVGGCDTHQISHVVHLHAWLYCFALSCVDIILHNCFVLLLVCNICCVVAPCYYLYFIIVCIQLFCFCLIICINILQCCLYICCHFSWRCSV